MRSSERNFASLQDAALNRARWPTVAAPINEARGTHGSTLVFGDGDYEVDIRVDFALTCRRGERHQESEHLSLGTYHLRDAVPPAVCTPRAVGYSTSPNSAPKGTSRSPQQPTRFGGPLMPGTPSTCASTCPTARAWVGRSTIQRTEKASPPRSASPSSVSFRISEQIVRVQQAFSEAGSRHWSSRPHIHRRSIGLGMHRRQKNDTCP